MAKFQVLQKTIDENEQRKIELETREQRNCLQWYELRGGRITASNFGKIFKFQKEQTKINFAESLIDVDNDVKFLPDAVRYGIIYEQEAIKVYLSLDRCQNVSFFKRGLWIPTWIDCAWLGASVDGEIVEEDLSSGIRKSGIVEIKTIFRLECRIHRRSCEEKKGPLLLKGFFER